MIYIAKDRPVEGTDPNFKITYSRRWGYNVRVERSQHSTGVKVTSKSNAPREEGEAEPAPPVQSWTS